LVGDKPLSDSEACPNYFKESRKIFQNTLSPVHAFFQNSSQIKFSPNLFMPATELTRIGNEWTKSNGYHRIQWNKHQYGKAYEAFGVLESQEEMVWNFDGNTNPVTDRYVFGVGLAKQIDPGQLDPLVKEKVQVKKLPQWVKWYKNTLRYQREMKDRGDERNNLPPPPPPVQDISAPAPNPKPVKRKSPPKKKTSPNSNSGGTKRKKL
jgi:hypothetical protein